MDFTAPSFSLGFDSDEDDPPTPVGSDRREQPRGYAAPDPPSFSLGFDDDDDVEEPRPPAGGRREERARRSVAPDPPSFSLGFDDDDDVEEEPRPPAGGRREERARGSAAPDPPSFSLGFDDDDGEILVTGQRHQQARPHVAPRAPTSAGAVDEEDYFDLAGSKQPPPETNRFKRLRKGPAPAHPAPTPQVRRCEAPDAPSFSLGISDDDDDDFLADGQHQKQPRAPVAPRAPSSFIAGDRRPEPAQREMTPLKRLRKCPALPHLAPTPPPLKAPGPPAAEVSPLMSENAATGAVGTGSLEDDIEDWTTDEDRPVRDVPPSVGSCSTSSNSKFSLLNRGVLMTQSSNKANTSKFTQTPNFSASKSLEESCSKKLLPKITISPMRKILLLDSDTDADDEENQNKAKKPSPVKKRQKSMHKYMQEKSTFQENRKHQGSTTVQKSEAVMNNNWATPAFDEFCNEYFNSTKDAGSSQQKEGNSFSCSKVSQPKYPDEMEGHFQQQSTSSGGVLDDNLDGRPPAMHYFFHQDPRVRDLVRDRLQHFLPTGAGSKRENEQSRGKSLSYRRQFHSSAATNDEWVTPNRGIPVPTDVGKRRVHASGTQSGSGHWFTNDSGRRVYVSKNGQELTGQNAYRRYQKESGRGFNRYKKKGSSGAKRGAAKVKVETRAKPTSSGTKRGAAKVKIETAAKQSTSRAKRKR
ncbi:hypothetical protein SEVIR_7G256100v4 [Setaria viridis]|uniref:Uncharacterized protein n=1 Tax=Setaria viridis TaxID=4556 RepID=A0A4U6TWL8_SETVI|nr:nucleolar and coiled-body phosphoprotein 1 [Setaria viridis]TKW06692.1 hypothetical protein SEVIR_7G256100v2 [Setaria viridis]